MPFGLVTKAQLEAHAEELRREVSAAREDQQAVMRKIKLEWEEWWEKFSRLYARLSKRVKDSQAADAEPARDGGADAPGAGQAGPHTIPPEKLAAWRSRRGF
jgi:hypothetical protein